MKALKPGLHVPLLFVLALAAALWLLRPPREETIPEPPLLTLFCGEALQPPVDEIIEAFQRRAGVRLEVHYGPDPRCLNHIRQESHADILITEDPECIEQAEAQGILAETRTLAWFVPVIQVAARNPLGIQSLSDLASPGVRLAVADANTPLGRITPALFQAQGIAWEAIQEQIALTAASISELGGAVQRNRADAAILWRPVARVYPLTEMIDIPDSLTLRIPISAVLLKTARHPDEAREFLAFVTGPAVREILQRHQYAVDEYVTPGILPRNAFYPGEKQ